MVERVKCLMLSSTHRTATSETPRLCRPYSLQTQEGPMRVKWSCPGFVEGYGLGRAGGRGHLIPTTLIDLDRCPGTRAWAQF